MRAVSLVLMLLALTILHPGIALAAAIVTYLTAGKRRRVVQRTTRVVSIAPVARFPSRTEALAQRFGRFG